MKAHKTDPKFGIPYHPMLEFFSGGMRIIPAQGDERPLIEDIRELEQSCGITLPDDFIQFQLNYGAVYLEAKEEVWPRPEVYDVGPAWTMWYGFIVFGLGKDVPDWLDIRNVRIEFRENNPELSKLLPIFKRLTDPTYYCLTESGELVEVIHSSEVEAVDMSFDEFVIGQTEELLERIAQMKARNSG